jgi:hypothetical protein
MPAHDRVRNGISIVLEGRKIFSELSVLQNLHMGAYTLEDHTRLTRNLGWVFELFPILKERRDQAGESLSGGERRCTSAGLLNDTAAFDRGNVMGLVPIFVDKFALLKLNGQDDRALIDERQESPRRGRSLLRPDSHIVLRQRKEPARTESEALSRRVSVRVHAHEVGRRRALRR